MRRSVALFALCLSAAFAQPAKKLKVHISVDMEGVAGVVSTDQLAPGSFEYERFRGFMTREANAAVSGAIAAGATEIVVVDSHGNGENLLIEAFPPEHVRLIRGFPRHLGMMAGIDSTFDAAIFIGYHASTSNSRGVRAHTFSSAQLTRVALNGTEVTEGAWNAAIAGHFGVPVVFASGDDAAIEEIRKGIGPIDAFVTKRTLSFHAADSVMPQASVAGIEAGVQAALGHLSTFKPYRVNGPVTVEISFKHYRPVELLAYLKRFERPNSHTIRFTAQDMVEASDLETFITSYQIGLEP
ncbi:MAG TPA: M55 family metallopeptidase [Bryobacteraceae bacterium]|jgi:D-amino peptidase